MCRRRSSRLPADWQPTPFPQVLEEHQDHQLKGISERHSSTPHRLETIVPTGVVACRATRGFPIKNGYESRCGLRIANPPRSKVTKRCQPGTTGTTNDGKFPLTEGFSRVAQCFANILDLKVGISI